MAILVHYKWATNLAAEASDSSMC